jgi:hypothetical protein
MGSKGRPARRADNLTAICEPIVYRENVGAFPSLPFTSQHFLTISPTPSLRLI